MLQVPGSHSACVLVSHHHAGVLQTRQAFFSEHWEKQPAVFKATPGRVALFQGMCSLPTFINWLKQREKKAGPLTFGVDVNAARYRDGVRTTPNGEVCVAPKHD